MESSGAFGGGWRLGFLGVLHMEVFSQRLESEYGASVIVTTPSVPYKLVINEKNAPKLGREVTVTNPNDWLERPFVEKYLEPLVRGTVVCPADMLSDVMSMCNERRGRQLNTEFIDQDRVRVEQLLPLAEVITDFFPQLKQLSSGYASFDYEEAGYEEAKLVKVRFAQNSFFLNACTDIH